MPEDRFAGYDMPALRFAGDAHEAWCEQMDRMHGYNGEVVLPDGTSFPARLLGSDSDAQDGFVGLVCQPVDSETWDTCVGPELFLRSDEFTDLLIP